MVTNAIARTRISATAIAATARIIASVEIQTSRRSSPVGCRPARSRSIVGASEGATNMPLMRRRSLFKLRSMGAHGNDHADPFDARGYVRTRTTVPYGAVALWSSPRSAISETPLIRAQFAQQKYWPRASTPWPLIATLHCAQRGAGAWVARAGEASGGGGPPSEGADGGAY